jgi:hypothetical protein
MSCSFISVVRHDKHVDPKKNNKLQPYCTTHGKWKCDGQPKKELHKIEPKPEPKPERPVKKRWDDEDD